GRDPRRRRARQRSGDGQGPRPGPRTVGQGRRQRRLAGRAAGPGDGPARRTGAGGAADPGAGRMTNLEPTVPPKAAAAIRAPFLGMGATATDVPVMQPLALLLDLAGEAMRA